MVFEVIPLTTIGVIIVIALGISIFVKKLGQNEVIGFILAGFLLGPFWLGFLRPTDALVSGFAELGLFILLFYLGIELSWKEFLAAGSTVFGLAIIDMLLITGVGTAILLLLGYSLFFSIVVAAMLSNTSTALVAKFIIDKNLLKNNAAKVALSINVLQDFLGILLLVFLTSMAGSGKTNPLSIALIALVFATSAFYAVHRLTRIVEAWMKKNNFGHAQITLYALGIGLIVSTMGSALGLSTAIGAYFAGFALSETSSGKKIKRDVIFLVDFFLVFFFVGFGTTIFFDTTINSIVLPSLGEFSWIAALAIGLSLLVVLAHSFSTRIFGTLFGLNAEDASLSAILLFPLGEFLIVISTVAKGIVPAAEAKMVGALAFLLIIITLLVFQPVYEFRRLHQRLFSVIPRFPAPKQTTIKQHTPYTIRQAKKIALNLFIVLCLAAITVQLYKTLPNIGIPVIYSRQFTAVIVFAFFAATPFFTALRAFKRIVKQSTH